MTEKKMLFQEVNDFFFSLCNSTESVELSTSFIKENVQLSQHP